MSLDLKPHRPQGSPRAGRRARTAHRRHGPVFWILSLALVGIVAAGLWSGLWFLQQMSGDPGQEVELVIPDGRTRDEVIHLLEDRGIIESGTAFRLYLRIRSLGSVAGGEYLFVENQDFTGVLETLRAGPIVSTQTVTYPEGYSVIRMAEATGEVFPLVEPQDYRTVATDGSIRSNWQPAGVNTLEGLLFPDTYTIDDEATAEDVITRQLERFDEIASDVGLAESSHVTPYQALIVASMIEREVKRPEDRPKVARAVYNRLAKGMKLQIDATVFYGQSSDLSFDQAVETVTQWNTYRIPGLSATPISNPGRDSLMAALNPAEGNWIYWVTVNKETGETVFNESYEAHKQAIADARAAGTY